MKFYLVGGAVRDALLGLAIQERDYVVVGATPEEMLEQGFQPIGRNFPIFLHPTTHEEYALARCEKKTGKGHTGFVFHTEPGISLEQDLLRRDLTINAIAQDETGQLIDPYSGQHDLMNRTLRHVSPAFVEDPLRILRVARFCATLGAFDFKVHPDTLALMQKMIQEKALAELSADRIWQETLKALSSPYPERYCQTLKAIGGLPCLFPHLTHHGIAALNRSLKHSALIRFAALTHEGPYAYPCPKAFQTLAHFIQHDLKAGQGFDQASAIEQCQFLRRLDYYRRPERLQDWLRAAAEVDPHFPVAAFQKALQALYALDRTALAKDTPPAEIADKIARAEYSSLC